MRNFFHFISSLVVTLGLTMGAEPKPDSAVSAEVTIDKVVEAGTLIPVKMTIKNSGTVILTYPDPMKKTACVVEMKGVDGQYKAVPQTTASCHYMPMLWISRDNYLQAGETWNGQTKLGRWFDLSLSGKYRVRSEYEFDELKEPVVSPFVEFEVASSDAIEKVSNGPVPKKRPAKASEYANEAGVHLELSSKSSSFVMGNRFDVTVSVCNDSQSDLTAAGLSSVVGYDVEIYRYEDGKKFKIWFCIQGSETLLLKKMRLDYKKKEDTVKAGNALNLVVPLNLLYDVQRPQQYCMRVSKAFVDSEKKSATKKVTSNELVFSVLLKDEVTENENK